MRFFAPILKAEEQADGSLIVEGIASTEAVDRAGEVVKASAIRDALPDFFAHGTGALREMHQLSAVGVVNDAEVDDTNKTMISATVVDPNAILKVKSGVYKGFSIGGRVVERDKKNRKIITKLSLAEISLVDRPANAESVLTLWKTDMADVEPEGDLEKREFSAGERKKDAKSGSALPDGSFPIESREDLKNAIRAFGRAKDKAKAKAHIIARAKALGAESFLPASWRGDAKKADEVNPVTTDTASPAETDAASEPVAEVVKVAPESAPEAEATIAEEDDPAAKAEATLAHIEGALAKATEGEPEPETIAKGMYTLSQLADMIQGVAYMVSSTQNEAEMEGDGSPIPGKLREWLKTGIAIFREMTKEETDELLAGVAAKKSEASEAISKADAERDDLAKRLIDRDEAFAKMAGRLEPMAKAVDDLTARLARVEAAPRAAKTAGAGASAVAISKAEDSVGGASQESAPKPELSHDAIAKALGEMSEEDRTMALIKAARATPKIITYR